MAGYGDEPDIDEAEDPQHDDDTEEGVLRGE